jgi:arylformamidase
MHRTAIGLLIGVCCLALWLGPTRLPAASVAAKGSAPSVIKNIPYGESGADVRQSFDLYLPTNSTTKPPLLIFVHGGFWLLPDDDYRIGPALAENLVNDGVAVALVRYRLAPAHRHPAQAQDVAAAVARLLKDADKYGFDAKRVYLSGHSAGGHLASLVALDQSYLEKHKAGAIAGVISFSGLYDLAPTWDISNNQRSATEKTFGNEPAVLKRASPIHHARGDAPRFLIMSAFADFPGFALDARRFADALRSRGAKQIHQHIFKGADHFSLVKLDDENNAVRRTLLGFIGVKTVPSTIRVDK